MALRSEEADKSFNQLVLYIDSLVFNKIAIEF